MSKEIQDISLERLNNAAHYLFLLDTVDRAEADPTVSVKCQTLVANVRAAETEEDKCLKLTQKSLTTDDITAADKGRDGGYRGYKMGLESYEFLPSEEFAQAYRVLHQHLVDYGISTRMQLDKETSLLMNFVDDLETKYAAQVEKLSLTPFVQYIKAENEKVHTYTLERTEERMAKIVGAFKAARAVSDDALRKLFKMVNALALVEGEAEYADFIDFENVQITHYKREVLGQTAEAPSTSGGTTPSEGEGTTPEGGEDGGETPDTGGSDSGTEGGGTTPPPATGGGDDDDNGGSLVG